MSMLACILKNLYNMTLCTLLDASTLNHDHKLNGEDPCPLGTPFAGSGQIIITSETSLLLLAGCTIQEGQKGGLYKHHT